MGALRIRIIHHAVYAKHGGWIYVDDFLWALPHTTSPAMATIIALMLTAMGCPISWDKAMLNRSLTWIGWRIDLRLGIVQATEAKMEALRSFLKSFASGPNTKLRQPIEAGVGLAMWLATTMRPLKPWLSTFYHCLANPSPAPIGPWANPTGRKQFPFWTNTRP